MRAWFRALPIRRRLVAMTATSTAVGLLLAGGGFLAWDVLVPIRERCFAISKQKADLHWLRAFPVN